MSHMKGIKLVAYIVLLLLAVLFLRQFREQYNAAGNLSANLLERADGVGANTTQPGITNATGEIAVTATNALEEATQASASTPSTESGTELTNRGTLSALSTPMNATAATQASGTPLSVGKLAASVRTSWMGYMGAFVVVLFMLGGMAAWDFAQFIAQRAHSSVFQEDTEAKRDPEFEEAEKAWSNGEHLEAVRLMRTFLQKNPGEQYAALRIAEIYEKDLHNPLAASMEYEDILCGKLPREKWGWTAIHLSNLYSGKLNQPDKAIALLNRVVEEYPETGAARKARARMGLPEPEEDSGAASTDVADTNSESNEADAPPSEPETPSNLPRGFRPRK